MRDVTPAQLRALAARERAKALEAISRAEVYERAAADLEQLHNRDDSATIRRMDTTVAAPQKRRGQPLLSKGPIATAARRLGLSVLELSAKIGENYGSMRKWDQRKRVPERVEKKITALIP